MKKRKLAIITLQILDFIIMLVPLAIVVVINRDRYFYSYEGIKLSFGMILSLIFAILLIRKKVKFNYAIWLGIATLLVYLMRVVLADGVLILGMATIGACVDCFVFQPILKYQKKIYEKELDATINSKAMGNAMAEALKTVKNDEIANNEEEINGRG